MRTLAFVAVLALTACSSTQGESMQHYLKQKGLGQQTPTHFQHCHAYGCQYIADVEWGEKDWSEIKKVFKRKAKTPEAERDKIKAAIALFEQQVGVETGTHVDEWGTFRKTGHYQLDCVDESTNTTVYLWLLKQQGWLQFHEVEPPTARFPIIHAGRWPHQTAVISEIETGAKFVVDSWFHDNGLPPEIVPLKQWKEGWKPDRADDEA